MIVAVQKLSIGRPDAVHIVQGQMSVSGDPDIRICTLLGSCVAACIRDPVARIGGVNHFLLPDRRDSTSTLSYGVHAMELLINELLRSGARKDRLEAKLFGGGRMVRGLSDIGSQNADFAKRFLQDEGIAHVGGSLGGVSARRIEYWPHSGRVRQQLIDNNAGEIFETEKKKAAPQPAEDAGALELF